MADKTTNITPKRKIGVIGGGPGGYVAALRAAQLGASVTVIEKKALGGTCLNVGCIPTKSLLHTAQLYEEMRNGEQYGIRAEPVLDFAVAQTHKASLVKKLTSGVSALLVAAGVTVITGKARFADKNMLEIQTDKGRDQMSLDAIIIATGSKPIWPPIPGINSKQCIDSTRALPLSKVPQSMVIIGGGVIGVELATVYATLGTKVTIVEMQERILPGMDGELSDMLAEMLRKKGLIIHMASKVLAIHDLGAVASVEVETPSGKKAIPAEHVLVATGRKPHTEGLGLDVIGLSYDTVGIIVNASMETSIPDIYAIGDCNGQILLAHVASAQGEVAAEHAMGHSAHFSRFANPSCVYTNPEFAGVGLTEEEARKRRIAYHVGKFPFAANGKALIAGGSGLVKVLAGKEHHDILGVHILGPRATDMIAEAALAITLECTIDEIAATIHAHPTLAEAIREAALACDGRALHIPQPARVVRDHAI